MPDIQDTSRQDIKLLCHMLPPEKSNTYIEYRVNFGGLGTVSFIILPTSGGIFHKGGMANPPEIV